MAGSAARLRRRLLVSVAVGGAVAAVLAAGSLAGSLAGAQARGVDLLFLSRPVEPARACTIVAIDQRSYRELLPRHGTMAQWPRALYAEALARLAEARPRVVLLDVFFDAPRPDDGALVQVMRRLGTVVTPAEAQGPRSTRPAPGIAQEFDLVVRPTASVRAAGAAEGVVNVTTDADTVVRSVPLLLGAGGETLPAAALVAAARFARRPVVVDEPPAPREVYAAGRAIPLDDAGAMRINFLGPSSSAELGGPVPVLAFVDVVEGRFDPALVRDRIVVLGLTIRGVDQHATPTTGHTRMWGVEVLTHAIETILADRYLVDASPGAQVSLLAAAALLTALLTALWRPLPALAAAVALLVAYLVTAVLAFERGIVLSVVYPPAALALAFAGTLAYRVVFEEGETRRVRDVIGRYLSPAVSRWVLEDPARLALGGETREMTVLFCDVRGFTAIARRLPPPALVALLNELMTALSEVVFRHDGVLDKYIGDAVMAFWNAPQAQPDHARRACRAALDMIATLERLRPEWERRGLPPLHVGVGINTGPMVVGNMGSRNRLAYTVLGDTVNVASRLEGLCKLYGVSIVIGDATRQAAGDAVACRQLDRAAVKGRDEPLTVWEVLADGAPADERLASWDRGLALYRARRWDEAADVFAALDGDGPSRLYLARVRALAADPPGEDWDGVFVADTK
jgi:adenylate cyclase